MLASIHRRWRAGWQRGELNCCTCRREVVIALPAAKQTGRVTTARKLPGATLFESTTQPPIPIHSSLASFLATTPLRKLLQPSSPPSFPQLSSQKTSKHRQDVYGKIRIRCVAVQRLTLTLHDSQSSTCSPPADSLASFSLLDRGINTFSPEGRLFQVEYSLEAIKLGSTAIGVATNEGVVLGVEKRVTSTLLETSSVEKIVEIDRHIGCAMSGLQADARSMVEHARVECQSHAFNYNEALRVESCTQAICDLALRFGESADGEESIMSRPFGVALLIAGYDEDGPSLYHAEPTGTFYRYDAKAIGSGSEGAQAELQNEYHKVSLGTMAAIWPFAWS